MAVVILNTPSIILGYNEPFTTTVLNTLNSILGYSEPRVVVPLSLLSNKDGTTLIDTRITVINGYLPPSNVHRYFFNHFGGTLTIDLTGVGGWDTYLYLYTVDSTTGSINFLASDDDSGPGVDSRLTITMAAGKYMLSAGAYYLSEANARTNSNPNNYTQGTYRLTFSLSISVYASNVSSYVIPQAIAYPIWPSTTLGLNYGKPSLVLGVRSIAREYLATTLELSSKLAPTAHLSVPLVINHGKPYVTLGLTSSIPLDPVKFRSLVISSIKRTGNMLKFLELNYGKPSIILGIASDKRGGLTTRNQIIWHKRTGKTTSNTQRYIKRASEVVVLQLKSELQTNYLKVLSLLNTKSSRQGHFIELSFTSEYPVWPAYLDGNLKLWEPQQFSYLDGNIANRPGISEDISASLSNTNYDDLDPYDFSGVDTTYKVLFHGPINLTSEDTEFYIDNIHVNKLLKYQVINNIQLLKINNNYWVYTIVNTSIYGDILVKPAPLIHNPEYLDTLNAETTFVLNIDQDRPYHIQSTTNPSILSKATLSGTLPTYYSNQSIKVSDFIPYYTSSPVNNPKLPVLGNLIVIRGGDNIYYDNNGFYYFDSPPVEASNAAPIISLANAINGDYSTDVIVVNSKYDPGYWKLHGEEITIKDTATIIYMPGALINYIEPTIIRKKSSIATIYTTDNFNTININRTEATLAGRIIVNGVNYWATMSWQSSGVYKITSYSIISDLEKLSTKELVVGKAFNKYN